MRNYYYIFLLIIFSIYSDLNAQAPNFIVKLAPFSTRTNDEFSPVYYKGGIVFCTNQRDNSLVGYRNGESRLLKIFFTTQKESSSWIRPKLLANEISTDFNDGPVTFNEKSNIIYYSRNNFIENSLRNISDTTNKLGIYSAELKDEVWTNIRSFAYNNDNYSLSTPALTPDGTRIYFSSDMPGGYGGMDLFYCELRNNAWDEPVNLGPLINTAKNESFPFAGRYGKLFFASDGHKGFGGKDLFYTQEIDGEWIVPVQLDSAINSPADDFGIVTDSTFEKGYFSSNRLKTDDIFSFSIPPIEFSDCDSIKENKYCFTFYDEHHLLIDTIPVTYVWEFGNGVIREGKEVYHCFPGQGQYQVSLSIYDAITGDTISYHIQYDVELKNIEQAYIKSDDTGTVDKSISFEGIISDLKGINITDYFWDFGEGFKAGGQVMNKAFNKRGEYMVKMGLLARQDSLGTVPKICVMKKIKIN